MSVLVNVRGVLVDCCETRDAIPQIRNINVGKNRRPTQNEVNFLRKHLLTLQEGLRDTQARMKETKGRLGMVWLNLKASSADVPADVFQAWLKQATEPPIASPASPASQTSPTSPTSPFSPFSSTPSVSSKIFGPTPAADQRSKSQQRASSSIFTIGYPDAKLHEKYVQFLGFISTLYVHQSTLRRYESNFALLKEELRLVKSLLDPLHGVPPEILGEIFLHVVEGSEMERRKASVERGDHPTKKPWPAPFALSAVCRHWRVQVCSNPRLWKYLVLDVRDREEYYSTPIPRVHERIRQHLKYSHNFPLDVTIIAWGDHLRQSIVPMIDPLLQKGSPARKLDTGLGRLELVTGGRNDIEAGYTQILEKLPPAQHLALVRVWQANTEIRVPASFCARLRRIEAYDAVFRLDEPCPSAAEVALFNMDRLRIRAIIDQTRNLEHLTVDGFRYTNSGRSAPSPIQPMTKLHTMALRVTDLDPYLGVQACVGSMPTIQLPALRKLILISMPDTISPGTAWSDFVSANGQKVEEVEVRAIEPVAGRHNPACLAHLCQLPALTSLHLVGACAQPILNAMAFQPIGRSTQKAPMSGVTRVRVSDCKLPKPILQIYGWSSLNPSAPWTWRRGNAKDIQVTLERVRIEDVHAFERRFTN